MCNALSVVGIQSLLSCYDQWSWSLLQTIYTVCWVGAWCWAIRKICKDWVNLTVSVKSTEAVLFLPCKTLVRPRMLIIMWSYKSVLSGFKLYALMAVVTLISVLELQATTVNETALLQTAITILKVISVDAAVALCQTGEYQWEASVRLKSKERHWSFCPSLLALARVELPAGSDGSSSHLPSACLFTNSG